MIDAGVPYWIAFGLTVLVAFTGGLLIQRVVLKPLEHAPVLALVVSFIALLSIFNAVAGMIWSYTIKQFPSPFPTRDIFGNGLVSTPEDFGLRVPLSLFVGVKGKLQNRV